MIDVANASKELLVVCYAHNIVFPIQITGFGP